MLENRLNLILISAIIVVCVAIAIPTVFSQCEVQTDANATVPTTTATEKATVTETETETQTEATTVEDDVQVVSEEVKISKKAAAQAKLAEKSEKKTEPATAKTKKKTSASKAKKAKSKTAETEPFQFATAAPVKVKASYDAQWNAGYLLAIDNPDKGYGCPHIELSDDDRDLLERLCYGEFGTGGFTGAALIAQSVKCAMVQLGTSDVKTVIDRFHYDGSTKSGTSEACKKAVIYIFDMDKDAVQHRILYMYNKDMVHSRFHESQNYICSFKEIRFFDKK